ncbi:hypothetical protein CLV28_1832 [Sediminihabitans luteus]|uniref:Uncharacterized protein n=1 Tax=Sediminihabitans luteus TaxID=1138585 RepID=A0A2M9CQY2_9CELL|nr:hypothetical protein [Sediminihabitans luteus]PJJ74336.1 hypothetical protein CLV28_1832 [Sediminihabitans luteus]GIJ00448.1 hypothetical protein Slu03_28250 [Sediminihabitans luteus]
MALWLVLLIAGVVLVILGSAAGAGILTTLGIVALVVGITLVLVGRGNRKVGR